MYLKYRAVISVKAQIQGHLSEIVGFVGFESLIW